MSKLDELDLEFDEKFGIYSNYADFCPDKEEYKSFARKYYELGKQEAKEPLTATEVMIGEHARGTLAVMESIKAEARLEEREALREKIKGAEEYVFNLSPEVSKKLGFQVGIFLFKGDVDKIFTLLDEGR